MAGRVPASGPVPIDRRPPLAALALAAGTYAAPSLAVLPGGAFPGVVTRLAVGESRVAFTFDDGPHPQGTPAVLAELERAGARATFFCLGEQARRHPAAVAEIVAAGHEVGLHGDRHLAHALMLPRRIASDLDRGRAAVEDLAGRPISALRAPFGAASLATLAYARRHRLVVAGWSRWGWDWRAAATARSIAASVTLGLADGDIMLLHDSDAYAVSGSWWATARAIGPICRRIADLGLEPVALCDALATGRD